MAVSFPEADNMNLVCVSGVEFWKKGWGNETNYYKPISNPNSYIWLELIHSIDHDIMNVGFMVR